MQVFIDETGDHDLTNIDLDYPLFMLGALLIEEETYESLNVMMNTLKATYFENPETFILHSAELKRPTNKKSDQRNMVMFDPIKRKAFYQDLDTIIAATDLKIITCLVNKELFVKSYAYPIDPYHFCFENLLNRIIKHGGGVNTIYAEKRGNDLDTELQAEYEKLCRVGIHKYHAQTVVEKTTFHLIDKKENINGLQLIDLILSCLGRRVLGKGEKMVGNDLSYEPYLCEKIVEKTFFPQKVLSK